ncbi:Ribosomal-protein-S18p-alanine acetyltransferase (EC 2.3.1.128), partial [Sideroxydans sp. CL21]
DSARHDRGRSGCCAAHRARGAYASLDTGKFQRCPAQQISVQSLRSRRSHTRLCGADAGGRRIRAARHRDRCRAPAPGLGAEIIGRNNGAGAPLWHASHGAGSACKQQGSDRALPQGRIWRYRIAPGLLPGAEWARRCNSDGAGTV